MGMKCISQFSDGFANSADSGSIHSKLRAPFNKLKLILSYLRSSVTQERLCDLALLSIERDETKKTNFDKSLMNLRQESTKSIVVRPCY